jgi:membrane-associated phospholipid phosphatase
VFALGAVDALAQGAAPDSIPVESRTLLHDDPASQATADSIAAAHVERRKGPGNPITIFLSDLGYVVSSPARMNRESAMWTAGVLGTTALLYAYDQELFDATQRAQGNAAYDAIVDDVGDFIEPVGNMGNTNLYYFAGWAAGWAFRYRPLQVIPFQILESHAISGGIRNVAEISVGRFRPSAGLGPRHFEAGDGTSFPSGHASVAFELATIASHHAKSRPVSIAAYTLASVMSVQRVDAEAHWPSDVLIAAATGHIIARTIVLRQDRREGTGIAWRFIPVESGIGVALNF